MVLCSKEQGWGVGMPTEGPALGRRLVRTLTAAHLAAAWGRKRRIKPGMFCHPIMDDRERKGGWDFQGTNVGNMATNYFSAVADRKQRGKWKYRQDAIKSMSHSHRGQEGRNITERINILALKVSHRKRISSKANRQTSSKPAFSYYFTSSYNFKPQTSWFDHVEPITSRLNLINHLIRIIVVT